MSDTSIYTVRQCRTVVFGFIVGSDRKYSPPVRFVPNNSRYLTNKDIETTGKDPKNE